MDEDRVIKALKKCKYRSDAKYTYDIMAGGLIWDDKVPNREDKLNWLPCVVYLRKVIAYSASLAEDKPRGGLRKAWDDLKTKLEEWPGFREERISGDKTKRILKVVKWQEEKCLNS